MTTTPHRIINSLGVETTVHRKDSKFVSAHSRVSKVISPPPSDDGFRTHPVRTPEEIKQRDYDTIADVVYNLSGTFGNSHGVLVHTGDRGEVVISDILNKDGHSFWNSSYNQPDRFVNDAARKLNSIDFSDAIAQGYLVHKGEGVFELSFSQFSQE